ncbi:MAG: hypothetical protein ABW123_22850 [Cystobacter sp.]
MSPKRFLSVRLSADLILVAGGHWPDGRSLTNAAEDVVAWFHRGGMLGTRRLLYEDTNGQWDEMLHAGGVFTGFHPLGACDAGDAMVMARKQREDAERRHLRGAFECPRCKRVSHNPNDALNRYCGACHEFFEEPR